MSLYSLAVECLKELYGERLEGVILFGSRARGDEGESSDYDILVLVSKYVQNPLDDYFQAYRALRSFREKSLRDTTVATISLEDLQEYISTSLILNALWEGTILYDGYGKVERIKRKLERKLEDHGIRRVKEAWGYTWVVPVQVVPFRLHLNLRDPLEFEYRLRLALEHLSEAERALKARALVAAAHEAQLAIENAAKSVIAVFKPPSWVHNPAPELQEIIRVHRESILKIPLLEGELYKLADIAEEAAPHHAISSYGDVRRMVTPGEVYREEQIEDLVGKAKEAVAIAKKAVENLAPANR